MPLLGAKSVRAPSRGRAYHQFTGGYDYGLSVALMFAAFMIRTGVGSAFVVMVAAMYIRVIVELSA